jgi:hypothetical protein
MNKKGWKTVTACGFLNMINIFWIFTLQDAAELIGMGCGGHAVFRYKVLFLQSQLFIEWVKALHSVLKVEPPASNLALYNLAIDKAVKKLHHALRGGLQQCNTTHESTRKEVHDLKPCWRNQLTGKSRNNPSGDFLHAALNFSTPKNVRHQKSQLRNLQEWNKFQ